MSYLLILILQTAHGYTIDRIEAPSSRKSSRSSAKRS